MALTVADLKWLQRELNEARRLRQWTRELLRGATDRTRPADAHFDGPDAFDGDLWWLLIPLQIDPDGLVRVWSRPDGRCAACQNGNGTRGIWIENREDETLIVVRDDESTLVGSRDTGSARAVFASLGRWFLRCTIEEESGRPVRAAWQQSADGETWDTPWCWMSVVYDDDADVLAVHEAAIVDNGVLSERTLFEQPVELPDDQTLARRAHDDLVEACHSAISASDHPIAGAQLWQLHGDDGALRAYADFELRETVDDLLSEPGANPSPRLPLSVIAPWSRRTYVAALEERLVERGDSDGIDRFAIGVVRDVNERLEAEHGPDGPVVLRAVGWLDEDSARPALTDAQWARWQAEDWTSASPPSRTAKPRWKQRRGGQLSALTPMMRRGARSVRSYGACTRN